MTALVLRDPVPGDRPILAEVGLAGQPAWIAVITCAWVGIGVLIAVGQSRRGHALRPLVVLGVAMGPFLYGYARTAMRDYEDETSPVVVRKATDHGGSLRLLVTVTGEPSGIVDALPVIRLFAPDTAKVEIARLVTFDVARTSADPDLDVDVAVRDLESSGVFLHDLEPGLVLVPGRGLDVLHRYAVSRSVDVVIVVGDEAAPRDLDDRAGGRTAPVALVMMGGKPHEFGFPI
ncbi:hypothetical protein [Actinospongicola halichondriae]|uniref:hypothetical protein n=1 Tax=Actinospongicola halichondriae TaxID=3236844 RepID=UPI003D46D8EB